MRPQTSAGAQLAGDDAGDDPQHLVAGGVAAAVVERLEVVDVDLDDAIFVPWSRARLEHLVQGVVQAAVVERAGQRVLAVEPVDPGLQRAHGAAERVDEPARTPTASRRRQRSAVPGRPAATSSAERERRSTG